MIPESNLSYIFFLQDLLVVFYSADVGPLFGLLKGNTSLQSKLLLLQRVFKKLPDLKVKKSL